MGRLSFECGRDGWWLVAIAILSMLTLSPASHADTCADTCAGDVTGDETVDVQDLVEVLLSWGPCPPECPADLDGSGTVDVVDLVEVLLRWGPCPVAGVFPVAVIGGFVLWKNGTDRICKRRGPVAFGGRVRCRIRGNRLTLNRG